MYRKFEHVADKIHEGPLAYVIKRNDLGEESDSLITNYKMFSNSQLSDNEKIDLTNYNKRVDIVIYIVGISEGLTHLASLATSYLLKDDLGLNPAFSSAIFAIPTIPWIIKPMFALIPEIYPFFGYKKSSYLIIFGIVQIIGYLMLARTSINIISVSFALLILSIGAVFCSIISETLVVEKNNQLNDANFANASLSITKLIGAKAVGSLIVAYFSGSLLEYYTKKQVFTITAIFPLLISISGTILKEEKTNYKENKIEIAKDKLKLLYEFFSNKLIWGPLLFIVIFVGSPDYDEAIFYLYTNTYKFSPSFMGSLRLTYGIAAILGIFLYQVYLTDKDYKTVMLLSMVINLPIYASPWLVVTNYNEKLHIPKKVFVLSGSFLSEAVAEIQFLPLLVFSSLICPQGLEGLIYSGILSIKHIGICLSKLTSSISLYLFNIDKNNYDNLANYIIFCTVLTATPLFFLFLIPEEEELYKFRNLVIEQKIEKQV